MLARPGMRGPVQQSHYPRSPPWPAQVRPDCCCAARLTLPRRCLPAEAVESWTARAVEASGGPEKDGAAMPILLLG